MRAIMYLQQIQGRGLYTNEHRAIQAAIEALRAPKYVAARMDSDPDPSIRQQASQ